MYSDSVDIRVLFGKCLFTAAELKNKKYVEMNCIVISGFCIRAYFNNERLEEYRESIVSLLNEFDFSDEGIPVFDMKNYKKGAEVSTGACEMLMCLGLAIGEIKIKGYVKDGSPIIVRKEKESQLKLT